MLQRYRGKIISAGATTGAGAALLVALMIVSGCSQNPRPKVCTETTTRMSDSGGVVTEYYHKGCVQVEGP